MDIVSVLTVLASLVIAAVGVMRARSEAASVVTNGFNALCTQLQGRIKGLESEVARLHIELALERKENRLLEVRIQELERERAELKAQLAALQLRGGC